MELHYTLDQNDFLQHQLYLASKSERIKKKRRKSWGMACLASLSLCYLFFAMDNNFLMYSFLGFTIFTALFYPLYLRRLYYKHYQKYIADYPRTDIIEGVLKICFNEPFLIPFAKSNNSESGDLDKYLGKYSSDQIVVNCTKDGGKLLLETRGKVFEVEKIGVNYFMNVENGYFFEFYPDKGELHIKETDNVYQLKRTN